MIDWETFKLKYKRRWWRWQDIVNETNLGEATIKTRIRDHLRQKISVAEVFKRKPEVAGHTFANGQYVTIEDVMKTAKIDRNLAMQRLFRVRKGTMPESKLLAPKYNQGQGGKLRDFEGIVDKLSPDRQEAWEALQREARSQAYLRQEQLMPTHDTPVFQGEGRIR